MRIETELGNDSANPVRVLLLTQREGWFEEMKIWRTMPNNRLKHPDVEFVLNPKEPSDITLVINHLPFDQKVISNPNHVWKWDTESFSVWPFGNSYTRIFSNNAFDHRSEPEPPILNWWIEKSFDDLASLTPMPKTKFASCIASTKRASPRFEFVQELERFPALVDVFGRGRLRPLADKFSALSEYRFSVAIENSQQPDYWTEKISDVLLSWTVPLYWGAPNIYKYFPKESVVWLPIDNPPKAIEIIRELSEQDDYSSRISAIEEARWNILNRYSLWGAVRHQIAVQGIEANPRERKKIRIHGRRVTRGGWLRGLGLSRNLRSQLGKIRKRITLPLGAREVRTQDLGV